MGRDLVWHQKKSSATLIEHNAFLTRIKKTLYYGTIPKYEYISRPMAEYAAEIFSDTHRGHSLNRLSFVTAGNVNVTPCSLILAIIYLDRLKDTHPEYARKITPTELFLVSMMVSTKFYCGYDEDVYMSEWAEYGNISIDTLKKLELDFLSALDWKAYVSNEEFFDKLKSIEYILARKECAVRGWLTYTEMLTLFPSFEILREFLYYKLILLISYTFGFITIASAFMLASHVPGNSLYNTKSIGPTTTTTIPLSQQSTTSNTTVAATNTSNPTDNRINLANSPLSNIDHDILNTNNQLIIDINNFNDKNELLQQPPPSCDKNKNLTNLNYFIKLGKILFTKDVFKVNKNKNSNDYYDYNDNDYNYKYYPLNLWLYKKYL